MKQGPRIVGVKFNEWIAMEFQEMHRSRSGVLVECTNCEQWSLAHKAVLCCVRLAVLNSICSSENWSSGFLHLALLTNNDTVCCYSERV